VRQHELSASPAAAERLAVLRGVAVGVVAAVGAPADQQRPDPAEEVVEHRVRARVVGKPRHVTARPGDEAVHRHRRRVQELGHSIALPIAHRT